MVATLRKTFLIACIVFCDLIVCQLNPKWEKLGVTDKEYLFVHVDKNVTWGDAKAECFAKSSVLAIIESKAEHDAIGVHIHEITDKSSGWWLGGNRLVYNHWKWDKTNQNIQYFNWCEGDPSNNTEMCLEYRYMYNELRGCWNDVDCDLSMDVYGPMFNNWANYICERPPQNACRCQKNVTFTAQVCFD